MRALAPALFFSARLTFRRARTPADLHAAFALIERYVSSREPRLMVNALKLEAKLLKAIDLPAGASIFALARRDSS